MSFNTEKHFSSGASSVTVSYSIDNGCQGNVTFEKGGSDSFIHLDNVTSGVKISIDANTGTSRTGHVYMKFNGQRCEDKTINIYQSGTTPGPVDCILNNVTFRPDSNQTIEVNGCNTSQNITLRGTSVSSYTNCESVSRTATKSVTVSYPKNESSVSSGYQVTVSGVSVTLNRTVCDSPEPEPENQYLTIESKANTSTNTIIFKALNSATTKTISASTDGESWSAYTSSYSGTPIATLDKGQKVFLRGENASYDGVCFKPDFDYEVYGNIMSLIYGESYKGKKELTSDYVFKNLFYSYPTASLTSAERLSLPAETLTYGCYYGMFSGCTSLKAAPVLPATTLAGDCYNFMFGQCSNLETAPELKATEMVNGCYANMFYGCKSLVNAPELPATTLANGCYRQMFYGCTSLTTAPDLPATTLVEECYRDMFNGCRNLNYIKCLATNAFSDVYTTSWVSNVASSGTFIKAASMSGWTTGINGIPEGWVVEDESDKFLTIKSLSDDNKIYFKSTNPATTKTVSVSTDNGSTWSGYTSSSDENGTLIATLNNNQKIWLKGGNSVVYENVSFASSGEYEVYGNIMSLVSYGLLYHDAFNGLFSQSTKLKKAENLILPSINLSLRCFQHMFSGCTSLETAPELPATTLAEDCYGSMFAGCTSLTTAPELPATTLATQCYSKMFSGCTSLTTAPVLSATTLAQSCYSEMFRGCKDLTTTPELPAETLARYCYSSMFAGCTSLETAPVLSATKLADGCYQGMFEGCTSLATAPELPATALTVYCYKAMFNGCTSLTKAPSILPAATLTSHCYEGMFNSCASLTTAPELSATTLAESCCYQMFSNCTSLTIAPSILPATTLASQCYRSMFYGCARLTTAPELPATTLTSNCYYSMFQNCANLNYIKAMFTTTPGTSYTGNWVSGVSNTGTFIKNSAATWENTFGSSAIPKSTTYKWTVETATA